MAWWVRGFAVVLVTAALGGCITKAIQEKETSEAGPKHDAYCQSIGAKPGTDTYAQCRLTMLSQLRTDQAETRARLSAAGDAVIAAGAQIQANAAAQAAANRPVNCTSVRTGNFVNTSCN